MSSISWAQVHGAAVHFPIAMIAAAVFCDAIAVFLWHHPAGAQWRTAGAFAVIAAALGTVPAVLSGLFLTRGSVLGSGALRWHHLFVWPAFGLIVAGAVWRSLTRSSLSRRACAGYVATLCIAAALISAAGYWGGELLQAFP
jgi:uncharacterized membrane protein